MATCYGLDDLGIESVGGEIFRTVSGSHPASCTMRTASLSEGKETGGGVDYPPEVKLRVELYPNPLSLDLCSLS